MIGFIGCYSASNALKIAHRIVRSEPEAPVLGVNCELCTLHLKDTDHLETLQAFCHCDDGCPPALVLVEPYTRNLCVAHRVAKTITAGTFSVNCYSEGDFPMPFGGYNEFGFGGKDKGPWSQV